jgi:hypothetical protein
MRQCEDDKVQTRGNGTPRQDQRCKKRTRVPWSCLKSTMDETHTWQLQEPIAREGRPRKTGNMFIVSFPRPTIRKAIYSNKETPSVKRMTLSSRQCHDTPANRRRTQNNWACDRAPHPGDPQTPGTTCGQAARYPRQPPPTSHRRGPDNCKVDARPRPKGSKIRLGLLLFKVSQYLNLRFSTPKYAYYSCPVLTFPQ